MLLKGFIVLFLTLIAVVTADSYDAYDGGSLTRKKTSNSKYNVKVYFKDNASCWYVNYNLAQPTCCVRYGKYSYKDSVGTRGENWHYCINVKKGTTITDVKLFVDREGLGGYYTNCEVQYHTLGKNLSSEKAACNDIGCLTRYGWVEMGKIQKIRNC